MPVPSLPTEIVRAILESNEEFSDQASSCLVPKMFLSIAQPLLHAEVRLRVGDATSPTIIQVEAESTKRSLCLLASLTNNADLATLVKELDIIAYTESS